MRVLLVLLALLTAGCATTTTTTAHRDDVLRTGVSIDAPPSKELAPPTTFLARDPDAPPVTTRDGAPTFAARAFARENGRHLCGGALLAVPEGAPDPRERLDELVHVTSHVVLDPTGRSFLTDEFVLDGAPVWVSNVGGADFAPDDGRSHCAAPEHEGVHYNVLLHAPDAERLDAWLLVREAPGTEQRSEP